MSWEYKTTEAVMKVLLRKEHMTKEVASTIDDFLKRESHQVPAEVTVLFKKLHSVFDTISNAIESEAENRPARKEDETDEDDWNVGFRSYNVEEMCRVRELAKEILETIESSKAFDEKFGIWNFNEYDSTELFVMQVIRNAYQID
jgi:hypothetical protein